MNASWPQTKTIWSICVKIKSESNTSQACDAQFWRKIAEEGKLTREMASAIIQAFLDKKSDEFHTLVDAVAPGWSHSIPKFNSARRWTPKKTYPANPDGPPPDPKPTRKFHVGARVKYIGSVYPWLTGSKGIIKVVSESQVGLLVDPWPKGKEGAGGHDLNGALTGDDRDKGWFVSKKDIELDEWEMKIEPEMETAEPEPESEDPFERKLKELEREHKKAMEKAAKQKALEKFKPESIEYVKPAIFDDVCAMVKGGVQVCLVGPSGCGKSLLVTEIAKVLKRTLYIESFAGGKRYAQVFGGTHLVDGKSEWLPAKFIQELQVENNIVFMDEVMSADPDVLVGANPILDRKSRCFHSPIGVINVNPTCTICAASNVTGREYSMNYKGTQQQDASVLNRFVHVHMGYDDKVEEKILKSSPLEETAKQFLLEQLKKLRRAISVNNISYDPSTRKLVQSIELLALGLPKEKAFEYSFLTPLSPIERTKISM